MIKRLTRGNKSRDQLLLAPGAVLGAVLLAALVTGVVTTRDTALVAGNEALRAAELRGSIVHLDEVLTMSARMAAATSDPRWIQRYGRMEPQLDTAIQTALSIAPPDIRARLAATTEEANRRLVAIEQEALALVAAGDAAAAVALLDGAEYERLKETYASGLDAFVTRLEGLSATRAAALARSSWMEALLAAMAAALLLAVLFAARGRLRLRRALDRTERAARTDPLTGLWNRRGFAERLSQAFDATTPGAPPCSIAVLLVDLDRFKAVNDAHGHDAGDRLLVEVAKRLAEVARSADALARLGGDEFALVMRLDNPRLATSPAARTEGVAAVARRIVQSLSEPIVVGPGVTARVGASVGIAISPEDGADAAALLRAADAAMYGAKSDGRGRVRSFDPVLGVKARARAALEADLRAAIEADAIEPHFQPMVDLTDPRRLTGMEVLARWHHPERGWIPPAEFVPVAEEAGLIAPLTANLLRRSLRAAAVLPGDVSLAFNVSAFDLKGRGLPGLVRAALAETGFDPARLELELTEGALLRDLDLARAVLQELSADGVRIALDDFGTGYSSLRHLQALPIDRLKVDASFVIAMANDGGSRAIVSAVLGLGNSLGLLTVAEGVEDLATLDLLRRMGCGIGQGWLFGRPVPERELHATLLRFRGPAIHWPVQPIPTLRAG